MNYGSPFDCKPFFLVYNTSAADPYCIQAWSRILFVIILTPHSHDSETL